MKKRITSPVNEETARSLRAGDEILLDGVLYTARDAAHKRLSDMSEAGVEWPFVPEGAVIYYAGPAPAPPNRPIGSIGPTSSYRMDPFLEMTLAKGVRITIGKGDRASFVPGLLSRFGGAYLVATGGAGALLATRIVEAEVVAFEDLGPEAIRRLVVKDFPAIVAIDSRGESILSH